MSELRTEPQVSFDRVVVSVVKARRGFFEVSAGRSDVNRGLQLGWAASLTFTAASGPWLCLAFLKFCTSYTAFRRLASTSSKSSLRSRFVDPATIRTMRFGGLI
jgi:hypothetical protein